MWHSKQICLKVISSELALKYMPKMFFSKRMISTADFPFLWIFHHGIMRRLLEVTTHLDIAEEFQDIRLEAVDGLVTAGHNVLLNNCQVYWFLDQLVVLRISAEI